MSLITKMLARLRGDADARQPEPPPVAMPDELHPPRLQAILRDKLGLPPADVAAPRGKILEQAVRELAALDNEPEPQPSQVSRLRAPLIKAKEERYLHEVNKHGPPEPRFKFSIVPYYTASLDGFYQVRMRGFARDDKRQRFESGRDASPGRAIRSYDTFAEADACADWLTAYFVATKIGSSSDSYYVTFEMRGGVYIANHEEDVAEIEKKLEDQDRAEAHREMREAHREMREAQRERALANRNGRIEQEQAAAAKLEAERKAKYAAMLWRVMRDDKELTRAETREQALKIVAAPGFGSARIEVSTKDGWVPVRKLFVAMIRSGDVWVAMNVSWNEEEMHEWVAEQHHFIGAQWHVDSTYIGDIGGHPRNTITHLTKLTGKELEQQQQHDAWLNHGLRSGVAVPEYTNGTGGNGWVYAFTMPSEARVARLDGKLPRVKIGMASGCYKQRIRDQVTAATMESPSILLAIRCGDPRALERQLHDALKSKDRHAYGGAGNEWFHTIPTEILELAGNCRFIG